MPLYNNVKKILDSLLSCLEIKDFIGAASTQLVKKNQWQLQIYRNPPLEIRMITISTPTISKGR